MNTTTSPESTPNSCPFSACSFSFCFWAKLIVAIPALPLAAILVGSFFENPTLKLLAMAATVLFLVYAAIKVDRMPAFSKMVVKRSCKK